MSVFAAYSRYYDLLYRDKDYAGEARYVASLIKRHAEGATRVVEIGCGTGGHARELAGLGFYVNGVDRSAGMLEAAEAKLDSVEPEIRARMRFSQGDARSVRLGESVDAVISLFHVMSYQTSNADLMAAFATARAHLNPGGVFIFDCWYGPAVLVERPAVTVKRLEDVAVSITRIAEPTMNSAQNTVDVNYTVLVYDRKTALVETLRETHRMRYLFRPEIELLLDANGMSLVTSHEWMTENPPGPHTWGACFVARG
ncbi:MAG: class I SAM-dependent methyltransferase [Gemmatimonadaceae bacterium]